MYLRDKVTAITHGRIYTDIKFFRRMASKNPRFNAAFVHELKPVTLGAYELLYQEGDQALEIFFILSGKVRLYSDLNAFIEDEELAR